MFFFLNEIKDKSTLHYDLCIIGSGFAALTIAEQFLTQSDHAVKRIAILESSTHWCERVHLESNQFEDYAIEQGIYQGEVKGWIKQNSPNYLIKSRLRAYGGTSNFWSGWCWPLETYDFKERKVTKGFEWPIDYEEILPFYKRAQKIFRLEGYHYDDPGYWTQTISHIDLDLIPMEGTGFQTRVLQFNPIRIHQNFHDKLYNSECVHVFRNANFLGFETQKKVDGKVIQKAVARTLENNLPGRTVLFKADNFILAAGAVETTRLLLLENVGSETTELGKNFLEHYYLWNAANFNLKNIPRGIKNFYFNNSPIITKNCSGIVAALVPKQEYLDVEEIGSFRILLGGAPNIPGTININWEQVPNQQSVLTLSDSLDIFDQRKISINHVVSNTDKKTILKVITRIIELLKDLDYAEHFVYPDLNIDPWLWNNPWIIMPGNHPMGTTRMSLSSEEGVVDKDCKVYGFKNLFIASSSVFPTAGYANPTLTIVALALRLSDNLKKLYGAKG